MYLLVAAEFSKPTDSLLMHSHFILINNHNSDYDAELKKNHIIEHARTKTTRTTKQIKNKCMHENSFFLNS